MANVLSVVWIVIAYIVTSTSITVWAALMLPNPVDRARERVEQRPIGSFFLGAVVWGVSVFLATILLRDASPGPAKILGWLILGPMFTAGVVGGAAVAQLVAGRIRPKMMNDSPIAALVGGALCTTLAGLLPIIGWFIFLPLIGFMSVGAGVVGLLRKQPHVEPVSTPDVPNAPSYAPPVAPAYPAAAPAGTATEPATFLLPGQPQQG